MLLWGLAAGIPVLIHLWNRRQQREVPWAAMQFLLAAIERQSRRLQLQHLLMLALRVAILVLLALALADPRLTILPSGPAPATSRTHTLFVLDGSYSMSARIAGASYFERAKEEVLKLLRSSRQGDGFTLVLMSATPHVIVRDVVFDAADVADEIEALRIEHSVAKLPGTLDVLGRLVDRATQRHPRFVEHRVVFVTDLAGNTWQQVENESVRRQLARLAERATLTVHEIGDAGAPNVAITGLDSPQTWTTPDTTATLTATLRAFATRPQRTRLKLLVDGREIADDEVEVPAGGEASVTFQHRFSTAGTHVVEARIGEDALVADNHRWFSLPVPESVEVLCVEGRPGGADNVALALTPNADQGSDLRPVVVGESALLEADLSRYACVFLCNVGRFRPAEARRLEEYVRRGGGLVVLLGDRAQATSYNEQLTTEEGESLLPAELAEVSGDGIQRFDPLEYRHPIAAAFRGNERSGLITAPTWRYVQLRPRGPQAELVLAFENGDPALVSHQYEQGRCVVLATAASQQAQDRSGESPVPWSALSAWPSFPPLMHEMLKYAVRGQVERRNVLVGQTVFGQLEVDRAPRSVTVVDPRDGRAQIEVDFDEHPVRFAFTAVPVSGVYRVLSDSQEFDELPFAVNVDSHESDLDRVDPTLLPSQFTSLNESQWTATDHPFISNSHALYRLCLATLLVLVLMEVTLARWFSRGST
jgi:hypothetical protein